MTRDELLQEKDRLEKIALRGERSIEFEDRRTEFRSWDDLKAQLDYLNDQIAATDPDGITTAKFHRVRYVSTHKDLG